MCEDFNKLVEEYMLLDKKTLAELLALKELANRADVPVIPSYPTIPAYPPCPWPWVPWQPGIGDVPWWPQVWYTTANKCEINKNDNPGQTITGQSDTNFMS